MKKYNRAFIIRNEVSKPILSFHDGGEDDNYWLFDSKESFHGENDETHFYFKDSRIPTGLVLSLDCVNLEFTEEEITEKSWNY